MPRNKPYEPRELEILLRDWWNARQPLMEVQQIAGPKLSPEQLARIAELLREAYKSGGEAVGAEIERVLMEPL